MRKISKTNRSFSISLKKSPPLIFVRQKSRIENRFLSNFRYLSSLLRLHSDWGKINQNLGKAKNCMSEAARNEKNTREDCVAVFFSFSLKFKMTCTSLLVWQKCDACTAQRDRVAISDNSALRGRKICSSTEKRLKKDISCYVFDG